MATQEAITNWQKIIIYIEGNKDVHFTDKIVELNKKYSVSENMCKCRVMIGCGIDLNGNCNDCGLRVIKK